MENSVSIWCGNFKNAQALEAFLEMSYDEEAMPQSAFMNQFDICYYDNDFQEAYCDEKAQEGLSIKQLVEPLSYAESYLPMILETNKTYNSIIALYNFSYENVQTSGANVDFLGVFNYNTKIEISKRKS